MNDTVVNNPLRVQSRKTLKKRNVSDNVKRKNNHYSDVEVPSDNVYKGALLLQNPEGNSVVIPLSNDERDDPNFLKDLYEAALEEGHPELFEDVNIKELDDIYRIAALSEEIKNTSLSELYPNDKYPLDILEASLERQNEDFQDIGCGENICEGVSIDIYNLPEFKAMCSCFGEKLETQNKTDIIYCYLEKLHSITREILENISLQESAYEVSFATEGLSNDFMKEAENMMSQKIKDFDSYLFELVYMIHTIKYFWKYEYNANDLFITIKSLYGEKFPREKVYIKAFTHVDSHEDFHY